MPVSKTVVDYSGFLTQAAAGHHELIYRWYTSWLHPVFQSSRSRYCKFLTLSPCLMHYAEAYLILLVPSHDLFFLNLILGGHTIILPDSTEWRNNLGSRRDKKNKSMLGKDKKSLPGFKFI